MLKVGLGIYEFDFPPGTTMGGYAARAQPSQGTHDRISARAIVWQSSAGIAALIEADFVCLIKARVEQLKTRIAQELNIPHQNVLMGIIHTHSAPLNGNLFTVPSPGVLEKIDEGIFIAVQRAVADLKESNVSIAQGDIIGVSFNRRDWDPLSNTVDNQVTAFLISNLDGTLRGIIYNYSCHPVVMSPENLMLTADWPFFTQQYLRQHYKQRDLFVMFMQGTPGNLNPRNMPMQGNKIPNTFEDCQEIGDDVGKQLSALLSNATKMDTNMDWKIAGVLKPVKLPIEDEDKAEMFQKFAEVSQEGENYYVNSYVQVIQIGSCAFVGFPGEIFPHIALKIKALNLAPYLLIIGYANDYIGYVGTPELYAAGGYEMMMMASSGETGTILEQTAIEMLENK